jgi:putative FmdB family regulatory protein
VAKGYFCSMPIYEFHCGECEWDGEILVRSADWKNSECPHCGSKKLSKKFSTFASANTGEGVSAPKSGGGHHCCGGGCHAH